MSLYQARDGSSCADDGFVAGWAHRQTLLTYCLQTVTSSIEAKKPQGLTGSDNERLSVPTPPSGSRRGWMEEEVLVSSP